MNATVQTITGIRRRHGGAALIASMLFLLILTLTGVTAMLLSTLEERMSGNLRDRNLAFQAAESALREGEAALAGILRTGAPSAFNCVAADNCPLANDLSALDVWVVDGVQVFSYSSPLPHVARQPLYRIEVLTAILPPPKLSEAGSPVSSDNSSPCRYRVTARGTGGTVSTTAIVQSTYAHLPNAQGACHG